MIDSKRLEAHLNNGKTEYVMCAANYYDDGNDHSYQPYNIDKGFVVCGWLPMFRLLWLRPLLIP